MPASLAALLITFAFGVPGFVYQRTSDRRSPERVNTALQELLAVVFGGAIIGVVSAVLVLTAGALAPATVDLTALILRPRTYVAAHLSLVLCWSLVTLACACLIAWIAGSGAWLRVLPGNLQDRITRLGDGRDDLSSWWALFQARTDAEVHVGCLLANGDYIAGTLYSFSRRAKEDGDRDLVISGDIEYRARGATEASTLPHVNAAVVSAGNIALLTVTYLDPTPSAGAGVVADPAP